MELSFWYSFKFCEFDSSNHKVMTTKITDTEQLVQDYKKSNQNSDMLWWWKNTKENGLNVTRNASMTITSATPALSALTRVGNQYTIAMMESSHTHAVTDAAMKHLALPVVTDITTIKSLLKTKMKMTICMRV